MREITAQLQDYQNHLDTLHPAVTVAEVEQIGLDSEPALVQPPVRWRRSLAFAAAFIFVLGLGLVALLIRNGDTAQPADVVTPSVTTPSTAPVTTAPTTPAPSAVSPEPSSIIIPAENVDGGTFTNVNTQTYREVVVDPEGGVLVLSWTPLDELLTLVRCPAAGCDGPLEPSVLDTVESVVVEEETALPELEGIAFATDGSPTLLISNPPSQGYTTYACDDFDCNSARIERSEPTETGPRIVIAPDGFPRITYWDQSERALKMAVCGDRACSKESRTAIILEESVQLPIPYQLQIGPEGRILVSYTTEFPVEAKVAVCADPDCSRGATIHSLGEGVNPYVTLMGEDRFLVWYRLGSLYGPEGEVTPDEITALYALAVVECDSTGCGEAMIIEADWELLWSWGMYEDITVLQTEEELIAGYHYWLSDICNTRFEATAFNKENPTMGADLGIYLGGYDFYTASVTEDGVPVLAYQDVAGNIHRIDMNDPPLPDDDLLADSSCAQP